jgi:hypothetical protein
MIVMYRSGTAVLPLHGGKAPSWLTGRMRGLVRGIADVFIDEYGASKFIARLSDPYWFQALGCVLAYDWHSSGVTTVVTGVLKTALSPEVHGVSVCGGKGKTSRKTPSDIQFIGEKWGFSEEKIDDLLHTSRMTAKVDNTAVQDGYQLYHHAFLVTEKGEWAVVQQGMSNQERSARRYHCLGSSIQSFTEDPRNSVACNVKREKALNMVAKASEESRKASVDLSKEPPKKQFNLIQSAARPQSQASLQTWLPKTDDPWMQTQNTLNMPRNINGHTQPHI